MTVFLNFIWEIEIDFKQWKMWFQNLLSHQRGSLLAPSFDIIIVDGLPAFIEMSVDWMSNFRYLWGWWTFDQSRLHNVNSFLPTLAFVLSQPLSVFLYSVLINWYRLEFNLSVVAEPKQIIRLWIFSIQFNFTLN